MYISFIIFRNGSFSVSHQGMINIRIILRVAILTPFIVYIIYSYGK